MLGPTHVAVGVASALVLTHPATIPGVMIAAAGGAAGGWISDIDCREPKLHDVIADTVKAVVVCAAALAVDDWIGNGLCAYLRASWGTESVMGLIGFLACCLFGITTNHRSFTHSVLGIFLMIKTVSMFCQPLAFPFGIGLVSHILLDLTNHKGIQLFWPLNKRFCLDLFDADGMVNAIIGRVASAIAAGMALLLLAMAVIR